MSKTKQKTIWPGIHDESPEEVGPGDVVHGVLFGGDGASHDLGIHVVRQHIQEAGQKIMNDSTIRGHRLELTMLAHIPLLTIFAFVWHYAQQSGKNIRQTDQELCSELMKLAQVPPSTISAFIWQYIQQSGKNVRQTESSIQSW